MIRNMIGVFSGALKTSLPKIRSGFSAAFKYIFGNPVRFLGGFLTFCAFIIAGAVLFANIFSRSVFVDDVEIQGSAKDQGYTGVVITQTALAAMRGVLAQRLDRLPSLVPFGTLVRRNADGLQTENYCNTSLPFQYNLEDTYRSGLSRVEMTSKAIDITIASSNLSLRRLASYIRKALFFEDYREIKPLLFIKDNKYVMRIKSVPLELEDRTKEFEKIEDAGSILADLLLDYLAPELLTTELVLNGQTTQSDFIFPRNVSEIFLQDKQKSLFIMNSYISTQLERAKSFAQKDANSLKWRQTNEKILRDMDFSIFKERAVYIKSVVKRRIMQAEIVDVARNNPENLNAIKIRNKHFTDLLSDLDKSTEGKVFLAELHLYVGDYLAFREKISQLLHLTTQDTESSILMKNGIAGYFLPKLIAFGMYEEAEKLISYANKSIIDQRVTYFTERRSIIEASAAVLNSINGDFTALLKVSGQRHQLSPCSEYFLAGAVFSSLNKLKLEYDDLTNIKSNLISLTKAIEAKGLRSLEFFNFYGKMLEENNQFSEAYEKYRQALLYEGDHSWVLLNWGWAAFRAGDYELAKIKLEESLEKEKLLQAVINLLMTLREQKDDKEFRRNAIKYRILIRNNYRTKIDVEIVSMRQSCENFTNYEPVVFEKNEMIPIGNKLLDVSAAIAIICEQ